MANTKSSIKRARQMKVRYERNGSYRSAFRTTIKKLLSAISSNEKIEKVQSLYHVAVKKIDKTAAKGLIHKNRASRYKSRLNAKVKKLATSN